MHPAKTGLCVLIGSAISQVTFLLSSVTWDPRRGRGAAVVDSYAPALLAEIGIHERVPRCAKGLRVWLALAEGRSAAPRAHLSAGEDDSCRGFLLRDDLVVTTEECGRYAASAYKRYGSGERERHRAVVSKDYLALGGGQDNLALLRLKYGEYHRNYARHEPLWRIFLSEGGTRPPAGNRTQTRGLRENERPPQLTVQCLKSDGGRDKRRRPVLLLPAGIRAAAAEDRAGIDERGRGEPEMQEGAASSSSFPAVLRDALWHEVEKDVPTKSRGGGKKKKCSKDDADSAAAADPQCSGFSFGVAALRDGSRTWYVRRRTRESLRREMQEWKERYRGADESQLDIVTGDNKEPKVVFENEDPEGGRFYSCFDDYEKIWMAEKPFSGEGFFDWLDYGSGRRTTLKSTHHGKCDRRKTFDRDTLELFDEERRRKTAVEIRVADVKEKKGGRKKKRPQAYLVYKHNGKRVTYGRGVKDNWLLFVQGVDGEIYASPSRGHEIHHTSFFHGMPILCAGSFQVPNDGSGFLTGVDFRSGHYKPEFRHVAAFYRHVTGTGKSGLGVPKDATRWIRKYYDKKEWIKIFGNDEKEGKA